MSPPIAHGIDLTPVDRVAAMLERHGERFTARVFTDGERAYADHASRRRRRPEHYAARFAAKEAAMKALGTGRADGVLWTDVEVFNEPSGAPGLRLHGRAAERAGEVGLAVWAVSLTHAGGLAAASVIATRA